MSIHNNDKTIFAKRALLVDGWAENVRLRHSSGLIDRITTDSTAKPNDTKVDTLLPALGNLHSHSFQRAMAGLTEHRSTGSDSFWTWRKLMYQFLDHLSPSDLHAIAAQVFMEMQEQGFAAVGEFHYLHHQPCGAVYDNIAQTSDSIFAAVGDTGIGLCHLPVLYAQGGVHAEPLSGGQLRFGNDLARFEQLVEAAQSGLNRLPFDARMGVAPHSLRAIDKTSLLAVQQLRPDDPIHMHIAEQQAEVDQIQETYGARPVEWLLANTEVDQRWCLIHATQMTTAETAALANSGAIAGLCPITEANLGDGVFKGAPFLAAGGGFGVGSDSNVMISLTAELRLLEYSQRLTARSRNVLTGPNSSVGETLYLGAAKGAAQALGRHAGHLKTVMLADMVALKTDTACLNVVPKRHLIDAFIFAENQHVVTDLWSAGRHCVKDGHHVNKTQITNRYKSTMTAVMNRI